MTGKEIGDIQLGRMGVSSGGDYDLSLLFSMDRVLRGVVEDTKTGRFGAVKRPYMVK